MVLFQSDYTEGAHENIMRALCETNFEQTPGYGADSYCEQARAQIKTACGRPDADVHFLVGGTQTNATVIAAALRPYQGAIAAETGHINVHETGAIESSGHKVLALPARDGKITAAQVAAFCDSHFADGSREHTVQPKMVYISHPSELGTMYTKQELTELFECCRERGMYLYIDGARLGYALASPQSELTLADIAALCDVFYIGGTKVGALFGEAVVILNDELKPDFRYMIKQHGGMLAKGRLLGIQFRELFSNGLYLNIARHAVEQALRIRECCAAAGYGFYCDSYTNQQFLVLPDALLDKLAPDFGFELWQRLDDGKSAVRFCTSWATRSEDVDALCAAIARKV